MVGQISTALAAANLNIADLLNKSRGELAYTLIDIDGSVPRSACSTSCAASKACSRVRVVSDA